MFSLELPRLFLALSLQVFRESPKSPPTRELPLSLLHVGCE